MKQIYLDKESLFSSGDELWIFSGFNSSPFLKKMDWYLNFLFFNADFKDKQKPTLVSAKGKLPTDLVLSLPFSGDIEQWAESIKKICKDLGQPKTRIFLPNNYNNPNSFDFDFNCPVNLVVE